jgi:hypothetical protein
VILPKKARRIFGTVGGIAFQARSQVSLTHSSASSAFFRMPRAIAPQYLPYFLSDSEMALSER